MDQFQTNDKKTRIVVIPPEKVEAMQAETEPVQQTNSNHVRFVDVLSNIVPAVRENTDLLIFAYYIYKFDYVRPHDHNDDDWIGIRQQVNFCNCAKMQSHLASKNASRLEQMYCAALFSGDYYTTLWSMKQSYPGNMYDRCGGCNGTDGEHFRLCPYFIADVIQRAASEYRISPDVIFDDLLGSANPHFRGLSVNNLNVAILPDDIKGIDTKSAYGAYLLLASKLIRAVSMDCGILTYTHLPLCKKDRRENMISKMLNFWKTGAGISCTLNVSDKSEILDSKTAGCKVCAYLQCPHKLAAYFIYLGRKYNVDPIDLAYYVAQSNTYAGISFSDNYQFDRFLASVKKSPMLEASKTEYTKMIYYIAGRKVNRNIPFLPFNIVFTSPDKEKAAEIVKEFSDAVWYFDYFRRGCDNTVTTHIYLSSTSFSELCDQYKSANAGTLFVLHDVGLLRENVDFKEGYHRLLRIIEDRRNDIMSIIIGDKMEVAGFFSMYPTFKSKVFTKTLEMEDMSSISIMDALEEKLIGTFTIPEEVYQRLEQYIHTVYPGSPLRGMEFVNDLYEKLLFNHYNSNVNADAMLRVTDLPYVKPPRSEASIFQDINQLTGLANVKQELQNVSNLVKFNIKMGAHNTNAVNLHMVFSGNPGTGKTTVARLTAEILHNIGFIQENKLVVCSAKDLIGEYLGQTTPKTAAKCEEAYNGVLFIDEAYQLNPAASVSGNSYREECIAELIQQMENNRDRLVVIFAGYTDEMEDFLSKANTGLRSRIGKTIQFPDYTEDELVEIFEGIAKRHKMSLAEGVREKIRQIFSVAKRDSQRFGNARYARNLFERSLLRHATITSYMEKDNPGLTVLTADEITIPES